LPNALVVNEARVNAVRSGNALHEEAASDIVRDSTVDAPHFSAPTVSALRMESEAQGEALSPRANAMQRSSEMLGAAHARSAEVDTGLPTTAATAPVISAISEEAIGDAPPSLPGMPSAPRAEAPASNAARTEAGTVESFAQPAAATHQRADAASGAPVDVAMPLVRPGRGVARPSSTIPAATTSPTAGGPMAAPLPTTSRAAAPPAAPLATAQAGIVQRAAAEDARAADEDARAADEDARAAPMVQADAARADVRDEASPAPPPALPAHPAHRVAREPATSTPAAPPQFAPQPPAAPSAPAPVMQTLRLPDAVLQRAMAAYAPPPVVTPVSATDVSLVQRANGVDSTGSHENGAAQTAVVDLDAIARDVYPILRRMLQVDRERRTRF